MLVELVLRPFTSKGAADGSEINKVRTALNSQIIDNTFFIVHKKKKVTLHIRSGTGLDCVKS